LQLIAGQRVRLAFGLSVATKCVWCDGVGGDVTEKMLQQEFAQYGKIQDLIIDRSRGHALVYFDQVSFHPGSCTGILTKSVFKQGHAHAN
jgi:RNA recognition motif. (a.k.a. RRM, RBD, or RNP domain)